jgi:peptide/nickel transport system substrate-binding protein
MSDKIYQAASNMDNVFQANLMYLDERDVAQPLLALRAPSQADGSWEVFPDGTMRTTYTLKPDLKWQDGQPLVADDFVFAHAVYTDNEIPVDTRVPENLMSRVVAPDSRTVEIYWRQPFVGAGSLANHDLTPIPRHVMGDLFAQDKGAFMASPYWFSEEHVSAGPFRLTGWERGAGMTFAANPYFALGKPAIDTIRVLFVADNNTVMASILAGAVDVFTTGPTELALTLKERWQADNGGNVYVTTLKVNRLSFQFRDVPNLQRAVLDLRVRQALMHAIDRQALAEAIEGSLGQVADTAYPPGSRLSPRMEQVIARYPFDTTRALALLRDAGWTPGSDGRLLDSGGRTLDLEIRSNDVQDIAIISDNWKRVGTNPIPVTMPGNLRRDDEYRAHFPATQIAAGGSAGYLTNLAAASAPNAATGWRGSQNRGTYNNPEFNRLYELQLTTLDPAARDNQLVELERITTQDVAVGFTTYNPTTVVARSVVKGIRNAQKEFSNSMWNVWEWSVADR